MFPTFERQPERAEEANDVACSNLITDQDLQDIWQINGTVPRAHRQCVHDLISAQVKKHPDKVAIEAWDGKWTYAELEDIASRFATRLCKLGLAPNTIVLHLVGKSKWTPLAIYAVMKAGGASLLVDCDVSPTQQPRQRLEGIISQAQPGLVVAGKEHLDLARTLIGSAVPISSIEEDFASIQDRELCVSGMPKFEIDQDKSHERNSTDQNEDAALCFPIVSPSDMLYINYTSGSTGMPKGAVITHENFCSAIFYQRERHGFRPDSRVYDFASYAFDAAWSNMIHALTCGACLCIPSSQERQDDLDNSIVRFGTTIVDLTPSVARMLSRETVATLETLIVAGEPLRADDMERWLPHVAIKNVYGPCETTPTATIADVENEANIIGRGYGVNTWVVDAADDSLLAPIGRVGELFLEGPLLGSGYLHDIDRTSAAFICDPPWLLQGCRTSSQLGRRGRLYKTGDLVRMRPDGSLIFVGRKDLQVKLHGQRIELGDIEYHVQKAFEEVQSSCTVRVVAEVVESPRTMLAAFVVVADLPKAAKEGEAIALQAFVDSTRSDVELALRERIPRHMAPAAYIALPTTPMTRSGKIDRSVLRAIAGKTDRDGFVHETTSSVSQTGHCPRIALLRRLWAEVLNMNEDRIAEADNFLRIGGDSMAAMKLVGVVRREGYSLSVATVFRKPVLQEMALELGKTKGQDPLGVSPRNALAKRASVSDKDDLTVVAARLCQIAADRVQAVYKCTPLQEDMLAATTTRKDAYVNRMSFRLLPDIDPIRFGRAVSEVVASTPILRTRIVDGGRLGLIQVVVADEHMAIKAPRYCSTAAYWQESLQHNIGLGTRLAHCALICDVAEDGASHHTFMLVLHHAAYDGWTMGLLMQNIERSYHGRPVPPAAPFATFADQSNIRSRESEEFWASQMRGVETTVFPTIPSQSYRPRVDSQIQHRIVDVCWPVSDITPSNLVRAACALMLGRYSDPTDVVFGAVVSGRQADVAGIDSMLGPTIATVPVRVRLETTCTVEQLLRQIQDGAVSTVPHEQYGLSRIRKINNDTRRACAFQTMLVIDVHQPAAQAPGATLFCQQSEPGASGLGSFDEQALTLVCNLGNAECSMDITFDSTLISATSVKRLAETLEHALRQLCDPSLLNSLVSELDFLCSSHAETIWTWNREVPMTYDMCLHDWIAQTAGQQDKSTKAVCAWDVDWSYQELDDVSTKFAQYLISRGVGRGATVVLLIEKTGWAPVVMLGIMKVGAVSAPLDIRQPSGRLHAIFRHLQPALVIATPGLGLLMEELAAQGIHCQSIYLEDALYTEILHLQVGEIRLATVSPSDLLYIIFTSGSTGTPKGVKITHSNFASAIKHQAPFYQLGRSRASSQARVLDFASYSFDVAWSNLLHALTSGACLCVPSETDRSNDLVGAIKRFEITFADFTPSVARTLPLDVIKSIETMNVGGEPLTSEDARRWSQLTNLINSYGPSECTSTSTIQVIGREQGFRGSIGKGAGCNTWVIDERRHLAPLGCVGELLLEGPLVGPGYFQSCDQTDSPFVSDLPWLRHGSNDIPGRSGRLYRTGDLVCYDEAGNLLFKGRKDRQIKIAGQRVELGEIESSMSQHDRVDQAACVFAETGPFSNCLVGFFTLPDQPGSAKDDGTRRLGTADIEDLPLLKEALRQHLTLHLPSHMIPAALCALSSLPRTSSGKLDTRSLMHILAESRKDSLSNESKHRSRKPGSEPERLIQKAIADVLGTSTRDVILDRSFVANGGDSISAMRLAPRCREDDIQVTVAQILKSESIAVLADQAQVSVESGTEVAGQPMTNFSYACSPMQQFFFAEVYKNKLEPSVYNVYSQHLAARLTCFCEPRAVSDALLALVADHAMLCARFRRESGNWVQYLPATNAEAEPLYRFMSSTVPDMAAAEHLATGLQYRLDIEHGPVFIAQLCDFPDGSQVLIMVAHHLVVDLVSWRIIAGDLQNRLTDVTSPASGTSFMLWNEAQQDRVKSSIFSDAKTVLPTPAVKNELSFWGFNDGVTSNKNQDHEELNILIGREITELLFSSANAALSTSPVDLLQAAVWLAFFRVFPERGSLSMFTEAHGREPWNENLDLSRTVGWFTTMAPLTAERHDAETVHSLVRHVKDMRRRLPANGWEYFTARFFNEGCRSAFESQNSTMEVEFNYLGQFQELESSDALLQSVDLDLLDAPAEFPASSLFVILASVTKGQAAFSFSFNRALARQREIREWANQMAPAIAEICTTLATTKPQLTLSDLSNARLTYDELDHLQSFVLPDICRANQDCTVQDIVTCAPMVCGMLISQMRDPSLYNSTQTYRVSSTSGLPVRPSDLERAWQVVVGSQPSLRAVFVENTDPVASFHQIVLKGVHATVVTVEKATETAARQWLQSERSLEAQSPLCPPHRLLLCKITNDPSLIICQFQMSHVITDGASAAILLEEWQRTYHKPDLEPHSDLIDTTRAFARLLDKMDKAHQLDYWKTKLKDSTPCHFPALDASHTTSSVTETVYAEISETDYTQLEQLCRENDITLSSLFQSAWALILHDHVDSADVCFGYLRAGRDLPVPDIERSIGAYANLLTCRVDARKYADLNQLARAVRRQMIEDLDFQYCSLAEIQHEIKCGHLFNSVFNYQQVVPSEDVKRGGDGAPSLVFEDIGGEDPNEYAVSAKITTFERTVSVMVEYQTNFLTASGASELLSQFLAAILAIRPE